MKNKYSTSISLILLSFISIVAFSNPIFMTRSEYQKYKSSKAASLKINSLQIQEEQLKIDIQSIDSQLHAKVSGDYTLSSKKDTECHILFPVPEDANSINISRIENAGRDKIKYSSDKSKYNPVDPNIAPMPFIVWDDEVINNARYNISYEYDLGSQNEESIFFYPFIFGMSPSKSITVIRGDQISKKAVYYPRYITVTINIPEKCTINNIWMGDNLIKCEPKNNNVTLKFSDSYLRKNSKSIERLHCCEMKIQVLPVTKETVPTSPDKTGEQEILEVKTERPNDIYLIDPTEPNTIDPNLFSLRIPSEELDSSDRSRFIIRPDTSKDHKIVIIPGDSNIDPGIYEIGKDK